MPNLVALSEEQMRATAPSIFATKPWHAVSDRYGFIPTADVVKAITETGLVPVKVAQSRTRIEGKGDFTKHMIRFRRAQDMTPSFVGQEMPELVLVNSHDRTSSYELMMGIFRLICLNGMVVKSGDFGSVKVHHTKRLIAEAVSASQEIIGQLPRVVDSVQGMKAITLSQPERGAFARAALELRYPTTEVVDAEFVETAAFRAAPAKPAAPITAQSLLTLRRYDDGQPTLWNTFNVVQENLMKGGIRGRGKTGRRMTTRAVNSVSEDVRLNKALWILAEEMKKAKQ